MASGYKFQYTGPITDATLSYGELWMWGRNSYGQIGDNTIVNRSSPVQTISGGTNWSSVVTSFNSSAAIKSDGTLWCWGRGLSGQLGDNTTVNKSSPIQTIAGGTNWSSVALGYNFRGGIKTDGTLWMWGNNLSGQLGDNTTTNRSSPVQTITGGTNWSSISCGYGHTAATKTDGTLWLWGSQGYWIGATGGLGDNTLTNRSSPVQTVAGGTNWSLVSITQNNAVALKTDNSLWVWGRGLEGQMGDNTAVSKSSPVQTGLKSTDWRDAWAGSSMVRALKNDGRIFTWGSAGTTGGLGDNANTNRSNPTQIAGSVFFKNVGEGSGSVHSGAVGNSFTTALVDLSDVYVEKQYFGDKLFWLWGDNSLGILGDNTIVSKSSPVQTVASGTDWSKIGSGYSHMAGIKTDGTLWTWGSNQFGELGDGTAIHRSSPVQTVAGGTNWTDVACGYQFTGAIKSDGTLWTFGRNSFGSLGTNSVTTISSPSQTAAAGTNWRQVACGQWHMAAIKTDGTLWAWGRNTLGAPLGDNTQVSKSSPVQTVTGGTNWAQVACGRLHTAARKTDGTLWGFGANSRGALGTNSLSTFSSPVQTIAAGTNWAQVACGYFNTLAIKTDGTLWLWGQNSEGQLGDNTLVNKSSPIQTIIGGTNWKQVATGCARHTVAIKTNGSLWVWGLNSSGQLGDATIDNKSSPIMVSGGTWTQAALGTANTFAIKVN